MTDLYTIIWWRGEKRELRAALTWKEIKAWRRYLQEIGVSRWQVSPYRLKRRKR